MYFVCVCNESEIFGGQLAQSEGFEPIKQPSI